MELAKVMDLIRKEAWTCLRKMGKQTLYDFDDLVQIGWFTFRYTEEHFDPTKGMKFSTLLCTNLKLDFCNILTDFWRKRINVVDGHEFTDIPEAETKEISDEDIVVHSSLSEKAATFVRCIFHPPAELQALYQCRKASKRSWSNNIRIPICQFLNLSEGDYQKIVQELRTKATWSPIA